MAVNGNYSLENGTSTNRRSMSRESRRASLALDESLAVALEKHEYSFVITDPRQPDHPIVYASDGFLKLTEYERDEIVGRNCRFLQGPETCRRTVMEIRDAIREVRPCQVSIVNYTKSGKLFWNLFHLAPIFSPDDGLVLHFVGVQTVLKDLSPAVAREVGRAVEQTEAASREDGPETGEGAGVQGGEGKGEGQGRVFGAVPRREEAVQGGDGSGNEARDFAGGAAPQEAEADTAEAPAVGEELRGLSAAAVSAVSKELQGPLGPSGERNLVKEALSDRRTSSAHGRLEGAAAAAEEEAAARGGAGGVCSSLMLHLIRIQQSFVLADPHLPDMPIVHASELFLELSGYPAEEVIGRNCRFLQGPGTDSAAVQELREAVKAEKPCTVRLLNYRKCGTPFWNSLHISPVRRHDGKVAFFCGVQLDVSAAPECPAPRPPSAPPLSRSGSSSKGSMSARLKHMGAVGAVRVAVRSLQGTGLRRSSFSDDSERLLSASAS
uniref:Putative LOV domain-containing protein n=1 Tax=Cylindrocystis brebissonii TaxID=102167 RepID=A0A126X476_9VIRI|nr:putative LOV domain-containing protein [Cylindrocystis brebissonii]|eukprot:TRINITY_DN35807_c0_g1_i1.p1 TRINITY_DN35807_c0_g1~~TRINITY_DN35807_c0_g1_i1.p1  ORF type:complete len:495 (-),score=93.45 TRINITY_DN35807_c0_g1_i1:654-2138(-)